MADEAAANYVISVLNDSEFEGRPLNVRVDSKPEKASGGKGGGGGGKGKGGKRGGGNCGPPLPCSIPWPRSTCRGTVLTSLHVL